MSLVDRGIVKLTDTTTIGMMYSDGSVGDMTIVLTTVSSRNVNKHVDCAIHEEPLVVISLLAIELSQ